jgi:hypothetical protein
MKKLISAAVVCGLAIGLVAVPGALGVKSPKLVAGSVSVGVSSSPLPDTTTTESVTGNLASNSSCRKDRTVRFSWVSNGVQSPDAGSAVTHSNGDFSAVVPRPADTSTTTSSVILRTTVDQVTRRVGSKKKGKKTKKGRAFECLSISADVPVALQAPPTL